MMAIQFNECGSDADVANLGTQITTDLPLLDYADCDLDDCPQIWIKTSDVAATYAKKFYYLEDTDVGLDAGWWRDGEYAQAADDIPFVNEYAQCLPVGHHSIFTKKTGGDFSPPVRWGLPLPVGGSDLRLCQMLDFSNTGNYTTFLVAA